MRAQCLQECDSNNYRNSEYVDATLQRAVGHISAQESRADAFHVYQM